ncbi:hypothetical protein J4H86_00410 [Spiractinospora alimapuensis]|uniref:hypothetical protein n=1 Tax=Spiractinospora alimapuensis TaxID=2820884 RepID=UPI001F4197EA|nr:hypothetical protein [Spiractinospora alimapuensis]QVQ52374.1 hypothetical protein J4H86_00410 [Spiractinospora alimapuensis]
MPGFEHEFPLDLIRHSPTLAAELFELASGDKLPEHTRVRCDASEANTTSVPERVPDSVLVLADHAFAALSNVALKVLEEYMGSTKYREWRSEFAREYEAKGEAKGKAEGKAQALLMLVESRGVAVSTGLGWRSARTSTSWIGGSVVR